MHESVQLYLATIADAEQLLVWRNDSVTRMFSINTEEIKVEEHLKWLHQSLTNPHRQLFIANYSEQSIGTVRVDSTEIGHFISWTLAPEYRGKGLAKIMVKALVNRLSGNIIAKILPDNIASIKVALCAGLSYQCKKNGILYFKYHKNN